MCKERYCKGISLNSSRIPVREKPAKLAGRIGAPRLSISRDQFAFDALPVAAVETWLLHPRHFDDKPSTLVFQHAATSNVRRSWRFAMCHVFCSFPELSNTTP